MTKREKRLERIRQNPKSVSFEDLRLVLEEYGFSLDRSAGSHFHFRAQEGREIPMMPNKDLDYYMKLPYTILFKPGQEEDEGWLAEIPELPGCFTAGDTKEEALQLLEEAKRLWLESSLAHGDPIPEPQAITSSG